NLSGAPPATTAAEAEAQLGEAVAVYLDGGPCSGDVPSTIVDLTGPVPKLLRAGGISVARLRGVVTLAVREEGLGGRGGARARGPADDAARDGAWAAGAGPDGAARDGAAPDGASADGAAPDGAAAE